MEGTPVYRVVIQDDWDPDLSWLDDTDGPVYRTDEDMAAGRNPVPAEEYRKYDNHANYVVRLEKQCPCCELWDLVDCIGGVDFYLPFGDAPETGVFELGDPRINGYVLQLVNEMLLERAA